MGTFAVMSSLIEKVKKLFWVKLKFAMTSSVATAIDYLLFLFPVAWGSAAVGEELLVRGYLLYRMEILSNTWIAVILQALIFSLAHLYQGWMGVINIFVLALVFGIVFVRSGRSLWPLILAHGLIDTIAITLIYIGRSDLLIGAS